jgi:hypothetical protein
MDQRRIDELRKHLNSSGVAKVRSDLASGVYGEAEIIFIENWLRQQDSEAEEKIRKEDRGTEEARFQQNLDVSRSLRNSSWIAAIFSGVAAFAAIIAAIIACYHK